MEKYITIQNKADCVGCTACYGICPRNAIVMENDEEGFLYPHVNKQFCISCGMCVRVCPLKQQERNAGNSDYMAVKHLDEDTRMQSTSGGVFTLLAEYVLKKEGAIYGAAFDDEFVVRHQRATDERWKEFRGAKYVQSEMGDAFSCAGKDLSEGKLVLFSGTSCQIHGLQKYLGSKNIQQNTLITCDIVCHGVPSPKVWAEFLSTIVENPRDIGCIRFRSKQNNGWHKSHFVIRDKAENCLLDTEQTGNLYGSSYFNGYTLRPSCFACRYTNFNRVGDFTIGDFWGIEKHYPDFDDNKGTSLLMVNTPKARSIYQEVYGDVEAIRVTQEECVQPNLQEPSSCYGDRNAFWEQYHRGGLTHACKFVGLLPVTGIEKYCYFVHRKWVAICNRIKRYC